MIRKLVLILSVISAVALLVVIACLLPDTVPTHFNFRGEADNWGSKWTYAWIGMIPVVVSVSYEIYRRKTPDSKSRRMEDKLVPLIALMFIPILWLTLPIRGDQSGMDVRFFCGVTAVIGLMMIILSNYMGKIRQNRHLGIRVPWVFKSEVIWNKTHRLGGFFGVLGGLVTVACSIIGMFNTASAFIWCMGGLIVGILLTVLVPTVYSAWLYNKLQKEGKL